MLSISEVVARRSSFEAILETGYEGGECGEVVRSKWLWRFCVDLEGRPAAVLAAAARASILLFLMIMSTFCLFYLFQIFEVCTGGRSEKLLDIICTGDIEAITGEVSVFPCRLEGWELH